MGCRSNGLSRLWAVGITSRPRLHELHLYEERRTTKNIKFTENFISGQQSLRVTRKLPGIPQSERETLLVWNVPAAQSYVLFYEICNRYKTTPYDCRDNTYFVKEERIAINTNMTTAYITTVYVLMLSTVLALAYPTRCTDAYRSCRKTDFLMKFCISAFAECIYKHCAAVQTKSKRWKKAVDFITCGIKYELPTAIWID
ncbi:hypothetical protein ScPMuIL_000564 [Solemya velum]